MSTLLSLQKVNRFVCVVVPDSWTGDVFGFNVNKSRANKFSYGDYAYISMQEDLSKSHVILFTFEEDNMYHIKYIQTISSSISVSSTDEVVKDFTVEDLSAVKFTLRVLRDESILSCEVHEMRVKVKVGYSSFIKFGTISYVPPGEGHINTVKPSFQFVFDTLRSDLSSETVIVESGCPTATACSLTPAKSPFSQGALFEELEASESYRDHEEKIYRCLRASSMVSFIICFGLVIAVVVVLIMNSQNHG
nr:p28 [Strawberry chlorotic fleck-associated virus]